MPRPSYFLEFDEIMKLVIMQSYPDFCSFLPFRTESGKVKLSLYLTKNAWSYTFTTKYFFMAWYAVMRRYAINVLGSGVYLHAYFVFGGVEWSNSRPGRFIPRERAPGTHLIGGWVRSKAGLHTMLARKIPTPPRDSNPDHQIIQPVVKPLYPLSYPGASSYSLYYLPVIISGCIAAEYDH
jgi:hypothetical protein